jgi:hypothetical protein
MMEVGIVVLISKGGWVEVVAIVELIGIVDENEIKFEVLEKKSLIVLTIFSNKFVSGFGAVEVKFTGEVNVSEAGMLSIVDIGVVDTANVGDVFIWFNEGTAEVSLLVKGIWGSWVKLSVVTVATVPKRDRTTNIIFTYP